MYIYTLFYEDTGLYNRNVFVMPNDAAAKKAMKINLMDPKAINFKNEVSLGQVMLKKIARFSEEDGCDNFYDEIICNLKDLLNDNNGDLVESKQDNT